MGNMVSLKQSHEVIAKVQTNCSWDELTSEQLQAAVRDPIHFGREFTRFLANGGRVQIVSTDGIVPPQGGKVLIVSVPVNESRPWRDAVGAVGPNTSRSWDVWEVGDEYPPVAGAAPAIQQITLVNFGTYTRSEGNLIWAKEQHLVPASPRAVFAIGEHCPYLDLAMNPMTVVSLLQCSFTGRRRVCVVWWSGVARGAYLRWLQDVWDESGWFAFVCE